MNEQEHEGILAIFLAEAEEIAHHLTEQFAELRYGYDGQRILDDIHRGFHTLYGGATVLKLDQLAECALLAERVMDRVRHRRVSMNPSLVSLFVSAIGAIELMLARHINHQQVSPIDDDLKVRLIRAGDRNSKPTAANNPIDPLSDPMGVFFDGRLRPRDKHLSSLAPSVLQYESGSFRPIVGQAPENGVVSAQADSDADVAQNSSIPRYFESGNTAMSTLTRQSFSELSSSSMPVPAVAENGELGSLVAELAWVRKRLMKFHGKGYSSELDKALAYLDLVAQDFESFHQGSE